MNEIAKQIIELGRLIGKKVFIKYYDNINGRYYYDKGVSELFTIYDFEEYAYKILAEEYKIKEITQRVKVGNYYLVVFSII